MIILITGGAGFVGSHLCRRLLLEGNKIYCLDNLITGTRANLEPVLGHKDFVFLERDVTEPLPDMPTVDWILHFASPASPVDYLKHPIETLKANTLGTLNCLELARLHGAKFLLASTSEIYGDPTITPQPEEYWGNVNPVGPRSCYDEGKRAAEAFSFAYLRKHGLPVHVIRIFNTYGPYMRPDDGRVVSNFIVSALKNENLIIYGRGAQTRSFCYIDDLIDGIAAYMKIDYPGPLNLGSTYEYSILDLAKKIIAMTGSNSTIRFGPLPQDDPVRRKPDNTKAKKILGWDIRVSLEDGLKKTLAYFAEKLHLNAKDGVA